jgi:hypothetical protein
VFNPKIVEVFHVEGLGSFTGNGTCDLEGKGNFTSLSLGPLSINIGYSGGHFSSFQAGLTGGTPDLFFAGAAAGTSDTKVYPIIKR